MSKLELLKRITDGNLGAESPAAGNYEGLREKIPAAGRFFVILWKKILFLGIGLPFAPAQRNLKVYTRFLTFQNQNYELQKSQLKKLNCSILLLLAI